MSYLPENKLAEDFNKVHTWKKERNEPDLIRVKKVGANSTIYTLKSILIFFKKMHFTFTALKNTVANSLEN